MRGPSGANDEFIEIYNNSGADHTVIDSGAGTGYAVAASDGVARCVIPNGTVIPNRGHYLCTNSVAYSLSGYATGDATYTTDIPDNAGIALFNTSVAANFILANRLDAVGSTCEANTLYKEGTGYPALTPFSIDYAFVRDECGKQGSITTFGRMSVWWLQWTRTTTRRISTSSTRTARVRARASDSVRRDRKTSPRRSTGTPPFPFCCWKHTVLPPTRRIACATSLPIRQTTRPSARSISGAGWSIALVLRHAFAIPDHRHHYLPGAIGHR